MAIPVLIGPLRFPSKKAAKQFFREIRDRYRDGEKLSEEDDFCLRALIEGHPEAKTKIGSGILSFTVETDTEFGNSRHFMIHRSDGSQTDVSFLSAIDGRNEKRDRYEALRRAISDQIRAFRDEVFSTGKELVCPLRQIPILESSYHVDHKPPKTFSWLVEEWLRLENISIDEIEITHPLDNQIVSRMTNSTQISSWQVFHAANAELRILSPLGNLSDARIQ